MPNIPLTTTSITTPQHAHPPTRQSTVCLTIHTMKRAAVVRHLTTRHPRWMCTRTCFAHRKRMLLRQCHLSQCIHVNRHFIASHDLEETIPASFRSRIDRRAVPTQSRRSEPQLDVHVRKQQAVQIAHQPAGSPRANRAASRHDTGEESCVQAWGARTQQSNETCPMDAGGAKKEDLYILTRILSIAHTKPTLKG